MKSFAAKPVTALLRAWSEGNEEARDQLLPIIYDDLRRRAAAHIRRERRGHTLQTTALVHEAYLRLVEQNVEWKDRSHFFALASNIMRRILVDHARNRKAGKRAGGWTRVELDEAIAMTEDRDIDVALLDEALTELSRVDAAHARIVELRFFGGLTLEETADVLGVSPATVKRDWRLARAWLYRWLSTSSRPSP